MVVWDFLFMKLGIFDSGLGGLFMAKAIKQSLPKLDFIYLGDTQRVPYGSRSQKTIHVFLKQAVDFLFEKDCQLIIVACNSASATALRKIQQEYLPKKYPNRRVLGVIIPTAESAINSKQVGILGTEATINSKAYDRELKKLNPHVKIVSQSAPLLVPLIENGKLSLVEPPLKDYLKPLLGKTDTIILGCTHYGIIKSAVKKIAGPKVKIISQTEIVPKKLKEYLSRHPDIHKKLSKRRAMQFYVTDLTPNFKKLANRWFGKQVKLQLTKLT